jgi:hypothetical protein
MLAMREVERVESRVLAGIRFVDAASSISIDYGLRLDVAAGTEISRNRSGLYVLRRHPPLAAHTDAFLQPPAAPAIGSMALPLTVHDPAGVYVSRSVTLRLPRDPDPANSGEDNSLFRPIDVLMYRSPAAPLGGNWAALRISLRETTTGDALGGALIRVFSNGQLIARGLTDWRGEALVPVVGIPITTWSDDDDAVIVNDIQATVQAMFDAANGGVRVAAADLNAGRRPANLPAANVELIEAGAAPAVTAAPFRIAAGQAMHFSLALDLPG